MSDNLTREQADQALTVAIHALREAGCSGNLYVERARLGDGYCLAGYPREVPSRLGYRAIAIGVAAVLGSEHPIYCPEHAWGFDPTDRCSTAGAVARGDHSCSVVLS